MNELTQEELEALRLAYEDTRRTLKEWHGNTLKCMADRRFNAHIEKSEYLSRLLLQNPLAIANAIVAGKIPPAIAKNLMAAVTEFDTFICRNAAFTVLNTLRASKNPEVLMAIYWYVRELENEIDRDWDAALVYERKRAAIASLIDEDNPHKGLLVSMLLDTMERKGE